jgi:tetratricopeptide (TPR) repeat protein
MLLRPPAAALLLCCAAGCAHQPRAGTTPADDQPPVKVATEEDYKIARSDFDALDVGEPGRRALREGMVAWAIGEARAQLAAGRPEGAFETFREQLLPLWDPDELRAPAPQPALAALAGEIERIFLKRGAHLEVLTALCVQIALAPADPAPRARFKDVVGWLDAMGPREPPCDEGTCIRSEQDLEAIAQVWLSPLVIDTLARSLSENPAHTAAPFGRRSFRARDLLNAPEPIDPVFAVTRLYLRASRPAEALAHMEHAGATGPLHDALARWTAKDAKPADAIGLAGAFFEREPAVAERVCRDAARRFPSAIEPRLCLGDVATRRGEVGLAIASFEKALARDPSRRDGWEALARLRQERLSLLVGEERLTAIPAELERVEKLHAEAAKRFPGQPLHTSLAGAYYECGRGAYNTGRIAEATQHFTRSVAVEPTVPALEQLGTIQLKQGRAPEALKLFERAEALLKTTDRQADVWWRAKLRRGMGEAYELSGDAAAAQESRKRAASNYGVLLWNRNISEEEAADAEVELGKVLYLLGDRDHAITAFQRAVDRKPDRGSSYADVLAFLVPRGELEESLDVYHRVLGRAEISEYLKVYCTLWILDLTRRAGQPEDPAARAFLEAEAGGKWYHDLARWAAGRASDRDLDTRATTASQRAEYWFYLAMRRLETGQLAEAQALWRKVLSTEMMAFFEYDMAAYYLRNGAAVTPTSIPKAKPAAASPQQKIPDGSI